MVFDIGERRLQRRETCDRFELGIGLGDGDDAPERTVERVLFAGAGRGTGTRRLHRPAARRHERLERAALVAGVALHDGDDVGNEVVAALELHVDIRPGVVAQLAQPNQAVKGEDRPADHEGADDRGESHGPLR